MIELNPYNDTTRILIKQINFCILISDKFIIEITLIINSTGSENTAKPLA